MVGAQQDGIHRAILEGGLDLGLVNYLAGDDLPPDFDTVPLLRGRAVVCLRPDHPLATRVEVTADELFAEPFVAMRAGYLMHRLTHRLLGDRAPDFVCTTDGADMGKLMVAEGLGLTLLPDFSVRDDPLVRAGALTVRPLAERGAAVSLVLQRRRAGSVPRALRDLHDVLVARAAEVAAKWDGAAAG